MWIVWWMWVFSQTKWCHCAQAHTLNSVLNSTKSPQPSQQQHFYYYKCGCVCVYIILYRLDNKSNETRHNGNLCMHKNGQYQYHEYSLLALAIWIHILFELGHDYNEWIQVPKKIYFEICMEPAASRCSVPVWICKIHILNDLTLFVAITLMSLPLRAKLCENVVRFNYIIIWICTYMFPISTANLTQSMCDCACA